MSPSLRTATAGEQAERLAMRPSADDTWGRARAGRRVGPDRDEDAPLGNKSHVPRFTDLEG